MFELRCDRCMRDLREAGALVFSPPKGNAWMVEKYHVCAECWPELVAFLNGKKGPRAEEGDRR